MPPRGQIKESTTYDERKKRQGKDGSNKRRKNQLLHRTENREQKRRIVMIVKQGERKVTKESCCQAAVSIELKIVHILKAAAKSVMVLRYTSEMKAHEALWSTDLHIKAQ